jgi:hypothetical protein
MSCNLSDGELYILNILYQRGCLNMAAGKNSKQIEKYYIKRGFSKDYDDAIHTLLNDGYITKIKKSDDKFYISDIKKAVPVLFEHGFDVTKGRVRPIK